MSPGAPSCSPRVPCYPHPLTACPVLRSSAAAGSFSLQFSKVAMTALINRLIMQGDASVTRYWVTWVSAGGLAVCAPLQLYLLNSALASGRAVFTIPLYTVSIIILAVVQGGVLFGEFSCLDARRRAFFFSSAVVVLLGILVLSAKHESRKLENPRRIVHAAAAGGQSREEGSALSEREMPEAVIGSQHVV